VSQAAAKTPAGVAHVSIACGAVMSLLPVEYIMENGLDVKNGIKLSCVQVQSGPEETAALIAGGIDIAGMTPANLFAILDAGGKLVAFQPGLDREYFDIIVRKGFALPDAGSGWRGVMKDLEHARIGVVTRGAAAEDIARALFQFAGLPATNATYIPTGLTPTTLAAMTNHQIDAAITSEPGITLALAKGIATEPFSIQELSGPPQMNWGSFFYVAPSKYAHQNAKALQGFQKAYEQGLSWVSNPANKSAAIAFVSKWLGVPPAIATKLYDRNVPFFSKATTILASRYNQVGDFYHQASAAKKDYHVTDYAFNPAG
jgi:ABC-type nitrate/sulfonate/bicarbonate transport system substrate-binding protein